MKYFAIIIVCLCVLASQGWAEANSDGMVKNGFMTSTANSAEKTQLMIKMMQQKTFKHQTITQAKNMVIEAKKQGLPEDPVINKAFEGMAKGVPEDAIVRAMKKVTSRYAYAYKKASQMNLTGQKRKQVGDTIAESMSAGLKEKDMDRIMEQLKTRVRDRQSTEDQELVEQSALTVRTMSRMGVASDVSGDVVCKALENLSTAQDMRKLQIRFREQARTRAADIVAEEYAKGLEKGVSLKDLGHYGSAMGSRSSGSGSHGSGSDGSSISGSGSTSGAGSSSGSGSSGSRGGNRGGRNR